MVEFGLIKIELLVCGLIGLIFIVDLFSKSKTPLHTIAVIGSLGLLVFSFSPTNIGTTFFDSYSCDYLSIFFKSIFCLNAFLVILLSIDFLKTHSRYTGEYYILIFSATLGMILLASAQEMLTFYVSLELLSISSYILAGYKKSEPRSTEAGIKYFLLGAMASAILLFGISFVYGSTGATQFKEIGRIISSTQASPILYIGLVLILVAMSFKIAVVPFHMWIPDVYEGAPTPIVAFFSIGTKAAGFAILMRVFLTAFYGLKAEWGVLMVVLSAMTMLLGNLAAIPQTNIKRLLGYSTIAQAGYILMGVAMASYNGIAASLYYLVAYLFSNLCAFAVIIIFSKIVGSDEIEDYSGLSHRSPGLAIALLLSFMSLAGIPPLVGFFGKLYLFVSAVEKGFIWLVIIGVLTSVISIYYYLMVMKRVYIQPMKDKGLPVIKTSLWENLALLICVMGIVVFGAFPAPIINFITSMLPQVFSLH